MHNTLCSRCLRLHLFRHSRCGPLMCCFGTGRLRAHQRPRSQVCWRVGSMSLRRLSSELCRG